MTGGEGGRGTRADEVLPPLGIFEAPALSAPSLVLLLWMFCEATSTALPTYKMKTRQLRRAQQNWLKTRFYSGVLTELRVNVSWCC